MKVILKIYKMFNYTSKGVIMKRKVISLGLGVLSVFLFFSCTDVSNDNYASYGVIKNVVSAKEYEIITDKGNTLVVTKSLTSQSIEEGKRVFANFEILSDKDKNKNIYEVCVHLFYDLLSKPIVNESFILEDENVRRDSIGNDPFNFINAQFGGDFINIRFELWHSNNSNKKHMINLVYDDLNVDSDTISIRLYHNAYGEVPNEDSRLHTGIGRCSFKISDLLPEGVNSKPVKLTWTEYKHNFEPKEYSSIGVFKKGDTSENSRAFSNDVGFEDYVGIK